jgi:hypothetical protein
MVLLAMLVLAACENPATPGRHIHAYGVAVFDGDALVTRAQGQTAGGELTVTASHTRGPLAVRMLDREGEALTLPPGYWLRVSSAAPSIARWTQTVEGEFGGALMGVTPGQTQLDFCLMHGAIGRGHEDGCQVVTVRVLPG